MSEVLLALDVGDARIGVARAEDGMAMAFGRGVVVRSRDDADVAEVKRRAEEEGARRVVVGLPLHSKGGDTATAERVRAFARRLEAAGLEVVFQDERFSTQLAEQQVRAGVARRGKRRDKGRVDEASAILILETYLRRTAGDVGA